MLTTKLIPLFVSASFLFTGCEIPEAASTNNKTITNNHSNKKEINLYVVVDTKDFNTKNTTKIEHYISTTNQAFKNSTIDMHFNIVKVEPFTFTSHNSNDALIEAQSNLDIRKKRNLLRADVVLIYRKYANDGLCGVAYTNTTLSKSDAYAHIALDCPSTTTAHEIGHVMGLEHSPENTHSTSRYSYGKGYGVKGEFSTIMSYTSTYRTNLRVLNYSSPKLDCVGYACGVEDVSDSVKALKNSLDAIVAFK